VMTAKRDRFRHVTDVQRDDEWSVQCPSALIRHVTEKSCEAAFAHGLMEHGASSSDRGLGR
jgi:hypothetical protein